MGCLVKVFIELKHVDISLNVKFEKQIPLNFEYQLSATLRACVCACAWLLKLYNQANVKNVTRIEMCILSQPN